MIENTKKRKRTKIHRNRSDGPLQDVARVEIVALVNRHGAAKLLVVDDDFRGEILIGNADLQNMKQL